MSCQVEDGVLVSALRYAIGRRTYVVSETCSQIYRNIPLIRTKLLEVMIRDIDEHEKAGHMGMNFDRAEWLNLRSQLHDEVVKRAAK
jgi:hypothetical protein